MKKFYSLTLLLIAILGFGVYCKVLSGEFVSDDWIVVEKNEFIRGFSHIPEIFTSNAGTGADRPVGFYRPIQIFSCLIDYHFWRLNPWGYHLTSILLHILTAFCVYWLAALLYGQKWLAFLTSLIFVVHPVNHEPVCFIAARADVLAALFSLLCFSAYLKYSRADGHAPGKKAGWLLLMIFSCALAFLSKESSLAVLLLIGFYHCSFKEKPQKAALVSLAVLVILYFILRAGVLPKASIHTDYFSSAFQRVPGIFVAIANYFILLIMPFWLHVAYAPRNFVFTDPNVILSVTLVAATVVWAIKTRSRDPVVFFSLGWFFLALAPVSNLYPVSSYMADRYLYLPAIGFFLLISRGLIALHKKYKKTAVGATAAIVIFCSLVTIRQTDYWQNGMAAYGRTVQMEPDNYPAWEALALEYYRHGFADKAIHTELRALSMNPYYTRAYTNLGLMYKELGRQQDELVLYLTAVKLNPGYFQGFFSLGNIYLDRRDHAKAIYFYQEALKINPQLGAAHNNLAVAYYSARQYDLAAVHCQAAVQYGHPVDPGLSAAVKPYQK